MAFPFQDDFSVGTIHGANAKASTPSAAAAPTVTEVVEIQEDKDNVSVLTAKTTSKAQSEVAAEAGLPPAPTPSAARPPSLPSPEPPAEDWIILSAMVRPVEP